MKRGRRLRMSAVLVVLATAVAGCRSTPTAASIPTSAITSTVTTSAPVTSTQTAAPIAPPISSVSSLPPLPADGEYLCKEGVILCNDRIGLDDDTAEVDAPGVKVLVASDGTVTPVDPTLALPTHMVYFQEFHEIGSQPMTATLNSVSTDGGASKVLLNVPNLIGNEGAEMGAPQVSSDGRYLAYAITVSLFGDKRTPTPAQLRGSPMQLGARIYVIDLLSPHPSPRAVPATLPGPDLAGIYGYQLAGWSADDKELYYFGGPNRDLEALTFDSSGSAVAARTLSRDEATGSCPYQLVTATMPGGDVLFDGNCDPGHPVVYRLHDDVVSSDLPLTELSDGWLVDDIAVDTTGRFVQLDASAISVVLPDGTTSRDQCVMGGAHLDFLDGALYSKTIAFGPCPPGTPARPAASPS